MQENEFKIMEFGVNKIPVPYESLNTSDTKFVTYGYDNLYPNYLLNIYAECGTHASIIENKTNYIIGDGLKDVSGNDVNFQANPKDNIKELTFKIVKDYLIFNYFCVEVVYNFYGEPIEFHHIPAHKIRTNKSKTKFWFNDDWYNSRKQIVYDRWSAKNADANSKIFFFDGYFPSVHNVYPKPEYAAAIISIEADISLKKFNLNNIKNHFSVSSLITFYKGDNADKEFKSKMIKDIERSFSGENGRKIMVEFQTLNGKPAEVKALTSGDWDKAYVEVAKKVIDDILFSHQVTSPMLFGIKTEGQLGGSTELETAFHIFKSTYVRVKRDALENGLNLLFSNFKGVQSKIVFGDKPLFNLEVSETLKEKVYTINELRKEAGLQALPYGDKLLSELPHVSESIPTPQVLNEDVKKKSSQQLTEDDFELIKHLGLSIDDFEIINSSFKFDVESDIAEYVISNDIKGLTLGELKDILYKELGLETSENDLKDTLSKLTSSGVIKVEYDEANRVKITPSKVGNVPDIDMVSVMYKYVLKPEISGPDLLKTSRSFCVKLIGNNRLYTRKDIQDMSAIFGYDIFKFKGGWYFNPETQESTSSCRHTWQAFRVKAKTK